MQKMISYSYETLYVMLEFEKADHRAQVKIQVKNISRSRLWSGDHRVEYDTSYFEGYILRKYG